MRLDVMGMVYIACDKRADAWETCKRMDTFEFMRMFYLKHKDLISQSDRQEEIETETKKSR